MIRPNNKEAYWLQIGWLEPFLGDVHFFFLQPRSVEGNTGMGFDELCLFHIRISLAND